MNLHIYKSKNSESFYVAKSYGKANGSITSTVVRKLGSLDKLLFEHGPTREEVVAWAKNEVKIETGKYKEERQTKTVQITFHADRQMNYDQQKFFRGGYLFLQSIYYSLQLNKACRKLKNKYKFQYDINAILESRISEFEKENVPLQERVAFLTHKLYGKLTEQTFSLPISH